MSRDELIKVLTDLMVSDDDPESAHGAADEALLDYINDPAITQAFEMIDKWYS
jgi:hypothetical protein